MCRTVFLERSGGSHGSNRSGRKLCSKREKESGSSSLGMRKRREMWMLRVRERGRRRSREAGFISASIVSSRIENGWNTEEGGRRRKRGGGGDELMSISFPSCILRASREGERYSRASYTFSYTFYRGGHN